MSTEWNTIYYHKKLYLHLHTLSRSSVEFALALQWDEIQAMSEAHAHLVFYGDKNIKYLLCWIISTFTRFVDMFSGPGPSQFILTQCASLFIYGNISIRIKKLWNILVSHTIIRETATSNHTPTIAVLNSDEISPCRCRNCSQHPALLMDTHGLVERMQKVRKTSLHCMLLNVKVVCWRVLGWERIISGNRCFPDIARASHSGLLLGK